MSFEQRRRILAAASAMAATSVLPLSRAWAADTLLIGTSMGITGPLSGIGEQLKVGMQVAVAEINAAGGIQGRRVEVEYLDDGYVNERAVANVKKLTDNPAVVALAACMGTSTMQACLPVIQQAGIACVGPVSGSSLLRVPSARTVFHVRASYGDEVGQLVARVKSMGISGLGLIYLDTPYGKEVLEAARKGLAAVGAKLVAEVPVALDGANAQQAVEKLLASKPSGVILGTSGVTSSAVVKAIHDLSPTMLLLGLSVTFPDTLMAKLGKSVVGTALPVLFPDPRMGRKPVAAAYKNAAQRAGVTEFTANGLEAYIAMRLLAEGLNRAGREPTRAKVVAAMTAMRNVDVSGFAVSYPDQPPFVNTQARIDMGIVSSNLQIMQ